MKKLFTLLLVVLGSATLLQAATVKATGKDVTYKVNARTVNEIEVGQAIQVNYTVGPTVSVSYTVPASIADLVNITCSNGTLKCRYKSGADVSLDGRRVVVNVVAPAVNEFEATSAAVINVTGDLVVRKLEIDASSQGKVMIKKVRADVADIDCKSASRVKIDRLSGRTVEIDASSSSSVEIAGTCDYLDASASSAASVTATKCRIGSGKLEASSSGKIAVSKAVKGNYAAKKSSAGTITIR